MNEDTPAGPAAPATDSSTKPLGDVIAINEGLIKDHLDKVVVKTVEETLNALLDAEADQLCGARRYEHSPERIDTRAGHYERQLHTKAGEVTLKMPKLRKLPFETAIIDRYQRREISVEEALVEMYLAGVSVRRVEDITQALWGTRVSPSTVSELNQKIAVQIEEWRNRPIRGTHPYVFLDGIWLKRSWGGEVKNVSILVAIGVDQDGYREVLGVMEGLKEDKASWVNFMRHMKERGLAGVRLFISDKCLGLVSSLADFYPEALWQRCAVHFYRDVWTAVPTSKVREVAAMLKAIHAQEDRPAAQAKAVLVVAKLREMKLAGAADIVAKGVEETLQYFQFPSEHWRSLRTNNPLERVTPSSGLRALLRDGDNSEFPSKRDESTECAERDQHRGSSELCDRLQECEQPGRLVASSAVGSVWFGKSTEASGLHLKIRLDVVVSRFMSRVTLFPEDGFGFDHGVVGSGVKNPVRSLVRSAALSVV